MTTIEKYLTENRTRFEDELCDLLKIPSVSPDPAHAGDVRAAGEWMAAHFREIGLETELIETPGPPVVFAQSPKIANAPTVLVYGHYDVQPPDPLDEWDSPPFEPVRRDGNIVARGATDDKGQMLTHVKSAEAWMKTEGRLPVNLKFLVEGEEEVGSEHLDEFIKANLEKLECDCVVVSDTSQFAPGVPAITYGLRGIAYYELRLSGPRQDLHSGTFGGGVMNPANALAKILAALVDDDGRIQVPGFYDAVVELTTAEREQFAALPFDEAGFMQQIGVQGLAGEKGFTTLERRWARPTCDINGLWSGYQGEGAKTVLPARAGAKFSFRLVPDQDPAQVTVGLRRMLAEICPTGIQWELLDFHGASGVLVSLDSPYMEAASRAIEKGFGKKPVKIREGGSIPVVSTFKELLGVDTLLLGWGRDDDNTHGPNEKFNLGDFHRGIAASAQLWQEIANL